MAQIRFKDARVLLILLVILLDCIGIGIVIPLLPGILGRFVEDVSQRSVAFGIFISIYALMQFLFSPLLGRLSDRFGRKPVLLFSTFFMTLDYLWMAFAPTLSMLWLGRAISGMLSANHAVASAYLSDISSEDDRAKAFGYMGVSFGIGFIAGPLLGGAIAAMSANVNVPFLVTAALSILNFILMIFFLPESLKIKSQSRFSIHDLNPFPTLIRVIVRSNKKNILFAFFCFQLAGQVHPACWTLYTQFRYDWSPAEVGFSLAFVGLLSAIAQGWGVTFAKRGLSDSKIIHYGLLGEAFSFFLYAITSVGWLMYPVLIFASVFWVLPPILQAVASEGVEPEHQGEIQGVMMSLTSIASIVTPIFATRLFSDFTDGVGVMIPGAPYFYGMVIFLVAWVFVRKSF